jgi:hypothetical protein
MTRSPANRSVRRSSEQVDVLSDHELDVLGRALAGMLADWWRRRAAEGMPTPAKRAPQRRRSP